MEKLIDAVQKRLDVIYGDSEPAENETKMFSVRLPLELIEKIDDIAGVLQTTKTDVARLLLDNAANAVIENFKIEVGPRVGMTFAQKYEFENASPEEQKALLEKWQAEAKKTKCPKCNGEESPNSVEAIAEDKFKCHECGTEWEAK